MKGLDVSHWNNEYEKIDWAKVKQAGFEFVIIKATEADSYVDPYLKINQADIRSAGLALGYYHFARAGDYKKEADLFLKNIGEMKQGEFLALDYELKTVLNPAEWCRNWLDYVESKVGFKPLLYTYHSILLQYDWKKVSDGGFGLWAARYGLQEQEPNENYAPTHSTFPFLAIWQYCSRGIVLGIVGNVDLNYAPMKMEALLGYGKPGGSYPSKLLDLKNWKLTLPIGNPTEIEQPQLETFIDKNYFHAAGEGVVFRAPVNGKTTSGSGYPRSELREMSGTKLASWSTNKGKHSILIEQAILAVPKKKKHIVVGQIHDSEDDIIVIRLEDRKLFVDVGGTEAKVIATDYALGTRFITEFVVENGKIKVYHNGALVYTLSIVRDGCYFKAGAYTQSNCSKEDECSENNYGEAILYDLRIIHEESTPTPPEKFLIHPIDTVYITQGFGENPAMYKKYGMEGHNGIDYRTRFWDSPLGKRYVMAAKDGKVIELGNDGAGGYGIFVRLEHNLDGNGNEQTIYAHLKKWYVDKNQYVRQGHLIGLTDNTGASTGPHLHWGYRPKGWKKIYTNGFKGYVDQAPFIKS